MTLSVPVFAVRGINPPQNHVNIIITEVQIHVQCTFQILHPPIERPSIIFIWGPHYSGEETNKGMYVSTSSHTEENNWDKV